MALQSSIQIYISGILISAFKSFTLNQEIGDHHDFKLDCRADVLENLTGELASESKNFLGESFIIKVTPLGFLGTYGELEFKGVVTAINATKGFHKATGDIVTIHGKSSCIITDDGPHYASHNDLGLSDVLSKTFQGYDISKLKMAFNPVKTDTLHYSVQQNESSYKYAKRLAAQYSEWFYYDGKQLVFGASEYKTIPLKYGIDLDEFSIQLAPQPTKYKYFTNDYLTDELHEKSTSEISTGVQGFNQFTSEKSNSLFAKETAVYINSYNDAQLKQRLDTHVTQQKKAAELTQVVVKGRSDNPGVHLGDVVTIQDETTSYGSFRITKVTHSTTENGQYHNTFEGVTAALDVYPKTDMMAFPKSETQVATVIDNVDPDGMSRIKVQFPWQKPYGEVTPWLRIVSPHAGGEKGFHFIPEKGEEVLVGFEGGNAERPYILGSLYTGTAQPIGFQSNANDIKAIQSRSGTKMVLNDNAGSMLLTDHGTASMMMDGSGKTDVATDVSHTTTVGEEASVLKMDKDGNIELKGTTNIKLKVGETIIEITENEIKLNGKSVAVTGGDQIELKGKGSWSGGDVFIN